MPNRLGLAAAFLLTAVLAGCTHPAPRAAAPSPPARASADRELVDYRDSAADPLDGKGSGCRPGGICESTMIQRITGNILRLFGQGPAARHQPSVPNWRQVTAQQDHDTERASSGTSR